MRSVRGCIEQPLTEQRLGWKYRRENIVKGG